MNYIFERGSVACTIFVPFVCGNNCKFCNTKSMYEGFQYSDEYLNKILNYIDVCNKNPFISGFILTGGEPFFNFEILKVIIDRIEKPISINTTLPKVKNIDEIINYINTCGKIDFLSVSRQLKMEYDVAVCDNSYLARIHKPIKINVLLTEDLLDDSLIDNFIKKYEEVSFRINFRGDYMKTTDETLKNIDKISEYLFNKFEFDYASGCLICYLQVFKYKPNCIVTYHRGIPQSARIFGDRCYLNDVIIDMYGNFYKDWDFVEDTDFNEWFLNQ